MPFRIISLHGPSLTIVGSIDRFVRSITSVNRSVSSASIAMAMRLKVPSSSVATGMEQPRTFSKNNACLPLSWIVLQMAPTSYLGSTSLRTRANSPASSSLLTNSRRSENGMMLPFSPINFSANQIVRNIVNGLNVLSSMRQFAASSAVMKLTKNFFPLRLDLVPVSRIDRMHLGKLIAPGKRPARVEYRPRVGEIAGAALFRRTAAGRSGCSSNCWRSRCRSLDRSGCTRPT